MDFAGRETFRSPEPARGGIRHQADLHGGAFSRGRFEIDTERPGAAEGGRAARCGKTGGRNRCADPNFARRRGVAATGRWKSFRERGSNHQAGRDYQRLLNYIVPDFVHVMADGRIIKSGDKNLALELESKGYDWLIKHT